MQCPELNKLVSKFPVQVMFATLRVPVLCIVSLLSWDPHYRFPHVMELPSIWTVKVIHQELWIIYTLAKELIARRHTPKYTQSPPCRVETELLNLNCGMRKR